MTQSFALATSGGVAVPRMTIDTSWTGRQFTAGAINPDAAHHPGSTPRPGGHVATMITIGSFDSDRETLRPLFSLADDSPQQIALYLNLGEILVAREGELIVGYVQLVPDGTGGACEIKSIAVRQERQCRGIGTQLIDAAIGLCRGRGHRRMIVATATADISNLRFYQRQGFRMTRIVPNVFTAENGYSADLLIDGIPLRDQVWFEHDL